MNATTPALSAPPSSGATRRRILLTGATGFVGQHLYPALVAAGWEVVCSSRNPDRARREHPDRTWVACDLERPETLEPALSGCHAAAFLIHGMDGREDYPEREAAGALAFREAAEAQGVGRIVYLGGPAPQRGASKHLASRLHTGAILRGGSVSAVELRAAVIIGEGSASWQMIRSLAERLPAMLLPRWLKNASWPLGIEDVVFGLKTALDLPPEADGWYDLPGPERIRHRDLLARVATTLVGRRPLMLNVPVLSPGLSSYWITLVTGVELGLARELVHSSTVDLDPSGRSLWDVAGRQPLPLDEVIARALADEGA